MVAGLAQSESNAECLREVDGWLATPGLLHPQLSAAHRAGQAAFGFLEQAHNTEIDTTDETDDPGITCLHDANGSPMLVNAELACHTPSGAIDIESQEKTSAGEAVRGKVRFVTPYARMAKKDSKLERYGRGSVTCSSHPWSSMCTRRFGRGIRLCLSEWTIHNQVGDYWNIHWYQSASRSAKQSAISAAAYIARGLVHYYLGGGEVLPAIISEGSSYAAHIANHLTKKKIAGHSIKWGGSALNALLGYAVGSPSVVDNAGIVKGFVATKLIDGLAQMAQVHATGWQDYSHHSHCKCHFKFSHRNKCK